MSDAHSDADAGATRWANPSSEARFPWRQLRTEDRMLLLVRAAVVVGSGVWTAVAPISLSVRMHCAILLGVFLVYSVVVLECVSRWPRRARRIYQGALAADLVLLYLLFARTGGIASPFLPAAFLLSTLTAFHYGPILGVLAACASLGLALLCDVWRLSQRHWGEYPLVIIFAALTAGYVGWIARRENRERMEIERLHGEVVDQARRIEAAYDRCREMQDHIVHSERLATIGRMSAEMAHQVRNPLSSISLNLELLDDEMTSCPHGRSEESRHRITAIRKEIETLAEVTESYLRFAQLPPFHWERVNLNEVVRDMVVFARPQIKARDVTVTQHLDRTLPGVRIDKRQFKFALMGVLTNALDAMSAGGRLRIRTAADNGHARLLVSDTGAGIPRAHVAKIFDPFFTTKRAGTGLGLSLTRRIVEAHGGRITCESIPDVGTTFTVSLPTDVGPRQEGGDGQA